MKLLGRTNGKIVIASMARYDYVDADDLMMDGGQPTTNHYAGYNRYSQEGRVIAFEVPQTFAELYSDYQFNSKNRKYGIWNIEDVRILPEDEWPEDTIEERAANYCWGTNGPHGDEKRRYVLLKDCSIEHLKAILANVSHVSEETKEVIEYLINKNES